MNTFRSYILILSIILLAHLPRIHSQEAIANKIIEREQLFKVSAGIQFWNVLTAGHEFYREDMNIYTSASNSWNNLLRRARLNVLSSPIDRLTIQSNFSADQIGKDNNSAINGGKSNNERDISILDLYARWKAIENSELIYLTTGLQRPIIGRETIVSSLKSSSFEKSVSQYYQRKQVVGVGHGRVIGLNVGGSYQFQNERLFVNYNFGIFSTPNFYNENNTSGKSNLLVARLGIDLGDPESKSYSTSAKSNYFGSRRGVSISSSYTYQGATYSFDSNRSLSIDALINIDNLNIDGEIFSLQRTRSINAESISYQSLGGYMRGGYCIPIGVSRFIEPVMMFTFYNAGSTSEEVKRANEVGLYSGKHSVLELGLNYHISTSIKLSLFYTCDTGNNKGLTEDFKVYNIHFVDSLDRRISRGDQLGIGLLLIL